MPGGLGDESPPHLPYPEFSFGAVVSGSDEMRRCVRTFMKYGVDTIKLNLSGEYIAGMSAETTQMTDAEIATAVEEVRMRGKRLAAHARSSESVKQCVRHGIELIYHASFTDEEALDMLEAHKHRIFVAPGLSVIVKLLYEGEPYGFSPQRARELGYEDELEAASRSLTEMHRRGIRVLPGGDYGFAWAPHWTNAMDLQYLVKYCGMTPMETIVAATKYGAQIMMMPDELGLVQEGRLADLLLVDGDPVADLSILLDPKRLLAVMKDGVFYKEPEIRSARTGSLPSWNRTAA